MTTTAKLMDDIAAVRAVIQLYADGAAGDVAKLRQAFHADAQMFGHIGDTRRDMPIRNFIDGVASAKQSLAGPRYRADIASIVVTGRAAVATLVEEDYRGCDFVDIFTLSKLPEGWKIVCKTFTCTRAPAA